MNFDYNLDLNRTGEVQRICGVVKNKSWDSRIATGPMETRFHLTIDLQALPGGNTTESESRVIEVLPDMFITDPFIESVEWAMDCGGRTRLELILVVRDQVFATQLEAEVYLVKEELTA